VSPVWFDPKEGVWGQSTPPLRDQDAGKWISSVNSWQRRNAVSAAGPDGKFYLAGGTGQNTRGFGPVRLPPAEIITLHPYLEIYDPETLTWSEGAPMKRPRQLFAGTFGGDGRLYVFGGYGHVGSVGQGEGESDASYERRTRQMISFGRHALRSVEAYDPKTNAWSDRAPMPEGRHAMGAALGADGRIYVVGGAVSYSRPTPTDTVFIYDAQSDSWERGPSLNQARYHHAVAAAPDGKIYAIGGTSGTPSGRGGPLASVEVLDTAARAPGQDLPPVGKHIGGEASWIVASPER
jgi:N-acetylneuraminic acid mutarotase